MDYKKEIERLLNILKAHGVTRGQIEQDFEYGDNYIDQLLSKGGNKKALAALRVYCRAVLPKSIPSRPKGDATTTLEDINSGLLLVSQKVDMVLSRQRTARAEARAYGQYQVGRDAKGDQKKIVRILAEIGRLVAEQEEDIAREDIPPEEGN